MVLFDALPRGFVGSVGVRRRGFCGGKVYRLPCSALLGSFAVRLGPQLRRPDHRFALAIPMLLAAELLDAGKENSIIDGWIYLMVEG